METDGLHLGNMVIEKAHNVSNIFFLQIEKNIETNSTPNDNYIGLIKTTGMSNISYHPIYMHNSAASFVQTLNLGSWFCNSNTHFCLSNGRTTHTQTHTTHSHTPKHTICLQDYTFFASNKTLSTSDVCKRAHNTHTHSHFQHIQRRVAIHTKMYATQLDARASVFCACSVCVQKCTTYVAYNAHTHICVRESLTCVRISATNLVLCDT